MDDEQQKKFDQVVAAISNRLQTSSAQAIGQFGYVTVAAGCIDAAGAILIAGGYSRKEVAEWLRDRSHKMMRGD